jgi:dihydroflavonol-4-reductase
MKAFVTGGTGFIGEPLVRRLIERGYAVTCLTRHPERATSLREMGTALVRGNITDPETMRGPMQGSDIVIHSAAWNEVGVSPGAEERMHQINVGGTENVLGLAVELGVPKIIYTSTVKVLGDTHGRVIDESFERDSPFYSACDRTKYQAHQVAEGYIAQGAPIIIVMPAGVYGPGDHSLIGRLLRLVLRRLLPIAPGADTGLSFVYVDDVAEGHVLAVEKGEIGATYILGGEVMTIGDAVQVIARLAGVPAPLLLLNSGWVAPLKPLTRWLERWANLPWLLSSETLNTLGYTWWVASDKAERELGYSYRAIEEGMAATVIWEAAQLRSQPSLLQPKTLLAAAVGLLTLGELWRQRRKGQK